MAKRVSVGGNQTPDPSKTSAAHNTMAVRISLVNALLGGTQALRAASEHFLPRYEVESDNNYRARVERATLVNYFRRSIESLTGKPFSTPVKFEDDMPQELVDISEDIDRQGNSINVFARRSFREGLAKGLTHILVEFPNVAEMNPSSIEEEKQLGAEPYFVHIPPEAILAAYCEMRNGVEFLTHVRIYETETKRVGFDEDYIERVRVLEPGTWTVWRKRDKRWFIEDSGTTTLDFIPLLTFYADREDFMVARPPLYDLAELNLAHFQSSSDQRNILTVARFPILAGSGLQEEETQIKLGPKLLLTAKSPEGKYYYVEHTGKAIEAGRSDLKDMEEQMSILGIELLKKSGDATATAKAIDSAENLSMLQAFAMMFSDFLEQAYKIAAKWKQLPDAGSVTINTEFGIQIDNSDLATLVAVRATRDISRKTLLSEMERRGTLSDEFDADADQEELDSEDEKSITDQAFQEQLRQDGVLPTTTGAPPPDKKAPPTDSKDKGE